MNKDIPDENKFKCISTMKLDGGHLILYMRPERGANDAFFTINNTLLSKKEHQDDNYSPTRDN
jgi:hypothetical protein